MMRERVEERGISIQSGLHVNDRIRTFFNSLLFFFFLFLFSFSSSAILLRVISNQHQRFVRLKIKSSEKAKRQSKTTKEHHPTRDVCIGQVHRLLPFLQDSSFLVF